MVIRRQNQYTTGRYCTYIYILRQAVARREPAWLSLHATAAAGLPLAGRRAARTLHCPLRAAAGYTHCYVCYRAPTAC